MANNTKADPKALAKQLMPDAALQRAMTNEVARVGDACVYKVSEDWVKKELAKIDFLKTAKTGSEFEKLARETSTKAVYVPKESALNQTLVCEILRRTAANIPVFME
jgi:hypothetical protein